VVHALEEGFGEDGGGGDGAEGGEEEHGGGDEAGGGDEEEEELGHHVAVGVVPGEVVAHDGRGRDPEQDMQDLEDARHGLGVAHIDEDCSGGGGGGGAVEGHLCGRHGGVVGGCGGGCYCRNDSAVERCVGV